MSEHVVSDTYTHLLQPDTVLPSQYFAALRRKSIQEPERRLVLAILEDAVDCFTKHVAARDRRSRQLFLDAEEWFTDGDREWPFAFENVCDLVGLDAGYLRAGLMRWKEQAIAQRSGGKVVSLGLARASAEHRDAQLTRSA